jgi:carbonic anhydrase
LFKTFLVFLSVLTAVWIIGLIGTSQASADSQATQTSSGHGSQNPIDADSALKNLREGNARFVAEKSINPHQSKEILTKLSKEGQKPIAAILSCADSRVPPEKIFDLGFGDLFVIRAAGAVPGVDQVGSLEYAVAHLGVPLIVVLSHTGCGAIEAAVTEAKEEGALKELLTKLSPVAQAVKNIDAAKRLRTAAELSAVIFKDQLPLISPTLDKAVKEGHLKIISGTYDLETGVATLDTDKDSGSQSTPK